MRTLTEDRMFAALSAANKAILQATSKHELYQRVCDAAVLGAGFKSAAALLPDEEGWLQLRAVTRIAGHPPVSKPRLSIYEHSPFGRGLSGPAFRSKRTAISNDVSTDDRLQPWHNEGERRGVRAAAAVPILQRGQSIGVFSFAFEEGNSLTDRIVAFLEQMVENVSFGLEMFEREEQKQRLAIENVDREERRKIAERESRRLAHMYAALNATNEAILRSKSRAEMFASVCEAILKGGRSLGAAAIFVKDEESSMLRMAAASGQLVDLIQAMSMSVDEDHPFGGGLHGPAFREKRTLFSGDVSKDPRANLWYARTTPPHGAAAVPLLEEGVPIGVLFFFFPPLEGEPDPEIISLMSSIGRNLSFGLDALARELQSKRLARMLAAISATNEAILHAQTRDELYRLVCDAVLQGAQFTLTTIALFDPQSDHFKIAAIRGPSSERIRTIGLSHRDDLPEGKGLSGTAFRTGQPAVSNRFTHDPRTAAWHGSGVGTKSGLGLPLFSADQKIGVLLFLSGEYNTFTPEVVQLLERLGQNVSHAIEAFDRRDERRRADERIAYLASHDALTDLPNRSRFAEILDEALQAARIRQQKIAILFLDLDRFKIINDSLGHSAGDTFLVEIAHRLRQALNATDLVARLGGDEFVVIIHEPPSKEYVEQTARKLLSAIAQPVTVAGHECRTTASIGIALYPEHGNDQISLTKSADSAMYAAKEDGKGDFRFFSPESKAQSVERLVLEASLRHALEFEQLALFYQPKIDARTGDISGVEALLRWLHPDLGIISPTKFIPVAEETGLIIPIGQWVLRTACAQAVLWHKLGRKALSVAVNLSPRQFQDANLLQTLDDVLNTTGMPPHLLQLEVTESTVMQNVERATAILRAIHSRGVQLAIDDFGTGYSSMSLMKHFPVDTIKVDRSFVQELAHNRQDQAIASAIISMGKALGLKIVAEGVETASQDSFLRDHQCDELQGYLFSKPVPAEELTALLVPQIQAPPLQPTVPRGNRKRRSLKQARRQNANEL